MPNPVISIKGLSVSYGRKRVLTNIFMDFEPGHVYGIIGPNGAGKSTLFKAVLGLLDINAGSILIKGEPIEAHRRQVVYVPQKSDVDWSFPATAFDIVLMGRYPHKKLLQRLNEHDRALARAALKETGMEQFENRQIGELSGGQQQRIFLARALCQEAEIFLLDEPFVGVDATTEDNIIKILRSLAEEGKTILVIHHDLSSVPEYFSRIALINQRLITFGDTAEAFTKENINNAYSGQLPILHQTGGWE